jgi:hypothetical protein
MQDFQQDPQLLSHLEASYLHYQLIQGILINPQANQDGMTSSQP